MKWYSSIAVCVMLLAMAASGFAADPSTVKGYVTDTKCGKIKNSDSKQLSTEQVAKCARMCIKNGEKMAIQTEDDQLLVVENPEKLAGQEGQHVAITGHITGKSIHVDSYKAL